MPQAATTSIDSYLAKLKNKIPLFTLLIHINCVNLAFTDCHKNAPYIIPYLLCLCVIAFFWELSFIFQAYYQIKKTLYPTCDCIFYVMFVTISRFISFIIIMNFTTSGMPLRCLVSFDPSILIVVMFIFLGFNFLMDRVETYYWKSISDLEIQLQDSADMPDNDSITINTKAVTKYNAITI